jgi:hypothetical protein
MQPSDAVTLLGHADQVIEQPIRAAYAKTTMARSAGAGRYAWTAIS